ncbi:efflux transporter periplasmic adaptor subunit [Amylibacter kogurei]|uniref:Efflux transporter periplasmic adaptor subunit n=2 Tax=Paramylibacter kogurei TaxID=1889778 RepID=A0A2G5K4V6_9RHOB|nr:efflux transporter periplasmic adaptor subunit [Amylibacter kogurei]
MSTTLVILMGAYVASFGIPAPLAPIIGMDEADQQASQQQDGPRRGGGRNSATSVVMNALETESYTIVLRTIGSAVSKRNATVITSETGEVVETNLRANAFVEKGDVLVRLDDQTQVLQYDIALAELKQAQDTVERYENLRQSGNSTITQVTMSEAILAQQLAEANAGLAKIAVEDRTIKAPISGRLGLSDIDLGDVLSTNDVVVEIDDSTTLLAEFEVPERSIGLLVEGKTVLVGTPSFAGRTFEGKIVAFDSRLDTVTRSATVQAEVDNSDGMLWSGMTLGVRMLEETDPLPVLPATAITWNRDGSGIWVVDGDGKTIRKPATIRYRDGDRVWVDTDVTVGTSVVVEGAAKLRDGANVVDVAAQSVGGARS